MTETTPHAPDRENAEDSPIVWFSELLIAVQRGEYRRASDAERQLKRLGWTVTRPKVRRSKGGGA